MKAHYHVARPITRYPGTWVSGRRHYVTRSAVERAAGDTGRILFVPSRPGECYHCAQPSNIRPIIHGEGN